MEKKKVSVSIIVPIYNSEEYLHRCLDSLVFQTLDDIEIIAVDNGSTDRSREIMDDYAKRFPNKCFAYTIEHRNYAGAGRNFGIKKAKGEYIAFCDSDDMLPLTSMEKLYQKAISEKYDLVYSPFYYCENGYSNVVHALSADINNETLLIKGNVSLWNKIYRRDLVKKAGFMPDDFSFEDLAYYQVLASNAQKIGYSEEPSYYYIIRDNSEVNTYTSLRMLDMLKACEYSQQNGNPLYKKAITVGNIKRVFSHIDKRWPFFNVFVEYIINTVKSIGINAILSYDTKLFDDITELISNYSGEKIPNTIVIGNSKGDLSDERISYLKDKAFYNGCNVVVAGNNPKETRDKIVESMIEAEKYEDADAFLALKYLYENGGFFLSNDVTIDNPFNYLKQFSCVFAFEYEGKITNKIFGCAKGEKIIKDILDTFEGKDEYDVRYGMSQRISNVLFFEQGVPKTNTKTIKENLAVFPNHMFVYNYPIFNNMFTPNLHFTHYISLRDTEDNYGFSNKVVRSMLNYGENIEIKKPSSYQVSTGENIKAQLDEVLKSNTYLVGLKIKKIFNKPLLRPFLRLYLNHVKRKKQ